MASDAIASPCDRLFCAPITQGPKLTVSASWRDNSKTAGRWNLSPFRDGQVWASCSRRPSGRFLSEAANLMTAMPNP